MTAAVADRAVLEAGKVFAKKEDVGPSTLLRLTAGGKRIEIAIPLRCDA